jgi:L-amino acid N-acyltransferase YncA
VADLTILPMEERHPRGVLAVYQPGIDTGSATFEEAVPSWPVFSSKWRPDLRLVAIDEVGTAVGWAAAGAVSDRIVHSRVAEHSVYVDLPHQGGGVGRRLLEALSERSESAGVWTLQSSILPENIASLKLHERCGFRVAGMRERGGCEFGQWRDVVMVERRSPTVGR